MSTKLTTDDFKRRIFDFDTHGEWKFEGELPAIIDFYADWCPPCKMVAPILESLAKQYEGKLTLYKVNTDEEPELAEVFGIHNLPSIMFIPQNEAPQIAVGALPKPALTKAINDVMKVV